MAADYFGKSYEEIVKYTLDPSQFKRELRDLNREIAIHQRAAVDAARVAEHFGIKLDQSGKQVTGVTGKITELIAQMEQGGGAMGQLAGKFKSGFGKIASLATGGFVAGIGAKIGMNLADNFMQGFTSGIKNSSKIANMEANFKGSIDPLRKATQGLVSDFDLLTKASRIQLLGPKVSIEQLSSLFADVTKVARASGKDVNEVLNTITSNLIKMTTKGVKELGVQVNKEKVLDNLASGINKTREELTKAESKLGFFNAVADGIHKVANATKETTPGIIEDLKSSTNAIINFAMKAGSILDYYYKKSKDMQQRRSDEREQEKKYFDYLKKHSNEYFPEQVQAIGLGLMAPGVADEITQKLIDDIKRKVDRQNQRKSSSVVEKEQDLGILSQKQIGERQYGPYIETSLKKTRDEIDREEEERRKKLGSASRRRAEELREQRFMRSSLMNREAIEGLDMNLGVGSLDFLPYNAQGQKSLSPNLKTSFLQQDRGLKVTTSFASKGLGGQLDEGVKTKMKELEITKEIAEAERLQMDIVAQRVAKEREDKRMKEQKAAREKKEAEDKRKQEKKDAEWLQKKTVLYTGILDTVSGSVEAVATAAATGGDAGKAFEVAMLRAIGSVAAQMAALYFGEWIANPMMGNKLAASLALTGVAIACNVGAAVAQSEMSSSATTSTASAAPSVETRSFEQKSMDTRTVFNLYLSPGDRAASAIANRQFRLAN